MKTIKKSKPKVKLIKTSCRGCGSIIGESEDKLKWEHDRDGRLARAKCPECGSEIFFY
jgi:ribosomal protein S27E